jgi:hypothetical protein
LVTIEEPELPSKGVFSPRFAKPGHEINFRGINVHNPENLRNIGRYYKGLKHSEKRADAPKNREAIFSKLFQQTYLDKTKNNLGSLIVGHSIKKSV